MIQPDVYNKLLEGKVALITGAGRGIGKAIAQVFANHGAKVVVTDIKEDWIKVTADQINLESSGSAAAVQIDVTNPESVAQAIKFAVAKFGKLDILVNNAGLHRSYPFVDFPLADFDMIYNVNVRGNFMCSQAAAKQMICQGQGGCIINMSSASGKKADPGGTAYNSSKSAVIGLTRVMALELGKYGIRVNCILPGATDTEMLRGVLEAEPGLKKILEERTPLGKMALPQDQANAALFLASNLASHITGEQLVVSGGEFMES
jgi:NAD(P)-dependent dehydrogenase (short-subunit alcohol dehydrogenase family)